EAAADAERGGAHRRCGGLGAGGARHLADDAGPRAVARRRDGAPVRGLGDDEGRGAAARAPHRRRLDGEGVMQRVHAPTVEFLSALETWLSLVEGKQHLRVELQLRDLDMDGDRLNLFLAEQEARDFLRPLLPFLVERARGEVAETQTDLCAAADIVT